MRIRNDDIRAVRAFNRMYTRRIGALDGNHLGSEFSLTEVRVLYELAYSEGLTATALIDRLGIDAGYLSRIVKGFTGRGLIARRKAPNDGRVSLLTLTAKGKRAFAPLDRGAAAAVKSLLTEIDPAQRDAMLGALRTAHQAMEPSESPVVLRDPLPGDVGWIVHRHGALYSKEYGYDERFEAIVARVVADFVEHLDPKRERCWIADRDGEILGSIFLVKKSSTVAKLRLLYLEPHARGLGLGRRLVDECIAFARAAGYRKITLWTQSSLLAARHIYDRAGFKLKSKRMHSDFGPREAAEVWELALS
jgi:DNA-binding MarR family transcriptional regulator/N-acetylglutamate synthase-like GNAT family acetyltransferase